MRDFSVEGLTAEVLQRVETAPAPRLREVMSSLVRHLHAFVTETNLTQAEWALGIDFLTRVGQMCDANRQELILLSDTLGVSMLVDGVNHEAGGAATDSTVLGPFFVEGAPEYAAGESIARPGTGGEPLLVTGRVTGTDGSAVAGALLEIWQSGPDGLYDVQHPEDGVNLRGRFRTDAQGRFRFVSVKPTHYPVPTDGPVGEMLRALGWRPMRPAHIHFVIAAPGYETLTTHLFSEGDPYLDSDAVFGVKSSLVAAYGRVESAEEAARHNLTAPSCRLSYDFVLNPAKVPAATA